MINFARLTRMCAALLFLSQTIPGISSAVVLNTIEEVDAYVFDVVENIRSSVEEIIQVPLDEQTFENTIRAWNRLTGRLAVALKTLNGIESQMTNEFHSFLNSEVFQNTSCRML